MSHMNELSISRLSNGIRVITEEIPSSKSVAIGVWANVGSRDEKKQYHGCSHFLEHLLFKGTKTRSAKEISTLVEERGGYLNAFTDRDMTCYHARVLSGDLPVAVDVLSDMVTQPLLRQEDIDTERTVVLSEIDSRDDDPGDLINDLYFEVAWGKNEAAHPILGEKEVLVKMRREDIRGYFQDHYTPSKLVVTAAGNLEPDKLVEALDKKLVLHMGTNAGKRGMPNYQPIRQHVSRSSSQVQVALTAKGTSYDDPERDALQLISSYLGLGASSKLFQEVREKRGLVYSIMSMSYSLQDSGLFTILAGTQDKYVEELLRIELRELAQLKKGMSSSRLGKIKHKTVGFSVLRSESSESRMIQLGASTLRRGEPKTLTEAIEGINAVEPDAIKKYAEEHFSTDELSLTTLGLSEETAKKVDDLFSSS
jgi:predicted Zn-dependent peptidase